jgi:hypothetical protein
MRAVQVIDADNYNPKALSKEEARCLVQMLQKQIETLTVALGDTYDEGWKEDEANAFNQFEFHLMDVERSIKRVLWALDKPMGVGGEQ